LICYRAGWLLPISRPPIRDGWVTVDGGRIVSIGAPADAVAGTLVDLGRVAVMPGLVNAHTHLELSYLRNEIPPASDFISWVKHIIAARRRRDDPASAEILDAVGEAIAEATDCGTAVVGDISNTLVTFEPLARSVLAGVVFFELLQFQSAGADRLVAQACRRLEALEQTDRVRASLAAHAPYSVAPPLFRAIRRAIDRDPFASSSVHLAEGAEEVEFIATGGGPWRRLLEELGSWDPSWVAPGGSPVKYLDEAGFLHDRVLAVHGVQMSRRDLARLADRGVTLVTCPRSNGHTGAGAPPLHHFYASGVRVAIGTDSLASAPDLNVFAELATMRALAPGVPAAALLDSATRQGARALGFETDYGSIEAGKRARLLAVDVPDDVGDVEEYLVSGIAPQQVRWIDREEARTS
jgi:cytosine/adenosine deaminase-related metal-dependent hydrolase